MSKFHADSGHRLFLLDRHMVSPMTGENGPAEQFSVLGATANGKPLATRSSISSCLPIVIWHTYQRALTQRVDFGSVCG